MKISKILFISILSLTSLNVFAAEVVCANGWNASGEINSQLSNKTNITITAPVLVNEKERTICVSVNNK